MRSGLAFLDADLTTIGGWLSTGLDWWRDELAGLVPARLRSARTAPRSLIRYEADGQWRVQRGDAVEILSDLDRSTRSLPLSIARDHALEREIPVPAMSRRDVHRLVTLDADRILPLPAERLLIAIGDVQPSADGEATARVQIAALPHDTAVTMMRQAEDAGLAPSAILLESCDGDHSPLDFTHSFVAAGLLKNQHRVRTLWWALVGFLFVLNIAVMIWQDVQRLDRLSDLVQAQAPAVSAARSIANRIGANQALATTLARRRAQQDGVAILAATSAALPAKAWVQRYSWDGSTVHVSGYRRPQADVIGAFRKAPGFADVRATNAEAIAEVPTGQPFDLTARVSGVRP